MLRQKTRLIRIGIYIQDIFITVASFLLAYWIRDTYLSDAYGHLLPLEDYLWLLFLIIPVWSLLLYYFEIYESFRTDPYWLDFYKVCKVVFWGTIIIGVTIFTIKFDYVSRLFIVLFAMIDLILLTMEKFTIRLTAGYARGKGYNCRNVIIVGSGKNTLNVSDVIEGYKYWGFNIKGIVTDDLAIESTNGSRPNVIGRIEDFPDIITKNVIDEVIFILQRKGMEDFDKMFLLCEEQGINTRVVLDFFPHRLSSVHLEHFSGLPLLTFSTTPQDVMALAVKRAFDIMISSLLLMLLFPLFLLLSAAIKLTSKGSVLYIQERLGRNGRRFKFYKFRSMVDNAEDMKKELEHLNEMDGPVFKIKNDPRVTRLGRFIRRTSIDELPQLMSVLKGDMSLVGPRPPVPEEVEKYDRWQRRRLSMKPGITCLWQVNGRNGINFKKWIELDLQYIDNWSLGLDFKILLKTIPAVLFTKGAS